MGGTFMVLSVLECAMVCAGVCGSAWVSVSVCVWDEFSEYLLELETRFLTSANYNMHPLRIFFYL